MNIYGDRVSMNIKELWKLESYRWSLAAVFLVLTTAFFYTYLARKDVGFDPLHALPNEALIMEEDEADALDFVSSDSAELQNFFTKQSNIDFTPFILNISEWSPIGTSILDYEMSKFAVVRYQDKDKNSLFLFMFAGHLEDLPPSNRLRIDRWEYQAYLSDSVNVIVWQHDVKTIGMLVGHLSTEELAHLVAVSSP